jgi:hypothetical protein
MEEAIKLDGRAFQNVNQAITATQDDYVLGHLRLAGIIDLLDGHDGKGRTREERAEDLLTKILLSGRKEFILAGLLTEEGKTWNRAEAEANAARFSAITDADEKRSMTKTIVGFVVAFFISGGRSSETSQKSSNRSEKVPPTKSAAPRTSATSHH